MVAELNDYRIKLDKLYHILREDDLDETAKKVIYAKAWVGKLIGGALPRKGDTIYPSKEIQLLMDNYNNQELEVTKTIQSKVYFEHEGTTYEDHILEVKLVNTGTPYKNDGKRENAKDIEPTDARAKGDYVIMKDGSNYKIFNSHGIHISTNLVQRIDLARQYIQQLVDDIVHLLHGLYPEQLSHVNNIIAKENIYTLLCEARFSLGFKLEEIRTLNN